MRTPGTFRALATWSALLCGCAAPAPRPTEAPARAAAMAPLPESARPWVAWLQANDLRAFGRDLEQRLQVLPPEARAERQMAWLGLGLMHLIRGDFGEDGRAFWQAVQADPASPLALVAAWQMEESLGLSAPAAKDIRPEVLRQLETPLPPELRFMLHRMLRSLALREGDWEAVEQHTRLSGYVPIWRTWAITGGDPRVMWNDVLRDFPRAFPAQGGRSFRPSSADGLLLYEEEGARGVWLAECLFQVQAAGTLWLRLESGNVFAAALDDHRLSHDDRAKDIGTVESLRFAVQAGWHRLRLAAPIEGGKAILGVHLLPAETGAPPVAFAAEPPFPAPTLAGSEPQDGADPLPQALAAADLHADDPVRRLLAALLAWSRGDTDRAMAQLQRVRQQAPDFSLVDYLEGVLWLESGEIPAGIAAARARRLWGRALAACPDLDLARFRLALLDGMEGREEQALEALRQLSSSHPESFIFPFFMASFFDRLGWNAEADLALERAHRLVDFDPDLWNLLFTRALRAHDEAGAAALSAEWVRRHQIVSALHSFFLLRGNLEAARRSLEQAQQRFGAQLGPRLEAVDLELAAGDLTRAQQALDRAEADFGPRPEVARRRMNLLDRQGKKQQAAQWLTRWIALWPWDVQLRLAQRALEGKDSLFSPGQEPAEPRSVIREYLDSGFAASGDAVLVLDQADLEVAPDGSSIERVHLLIRVLTATGVERWGEVRDIPPGAQVEVVRSLTAEGAAREAEVIPGKDSVSIPALQAGDFVEIAYRVGRRSGTARPGGFSASRFYFASEDLPIFRSLYTVRVPHGTPLVTRQHNGAPAPSIQRAGTFDVYRFERTRTAAVPAEPDAAPLDESAPFVEVGFSLTWRDARDLLAAQLEAASRPSWPVRQFAAHHAPRLWPVRERACALFRAVGQTVRRSNDSDDFAESAGSVLSRGEGNRLTALVGVLRAAGLSPEVYLARTVSSPLLEYRFPQDGVFTHGVVAVPLEGGESLWLDPADRDQPCGRLFAFLWDQPALRLTGPMDGEIITVLPPAPAPLPGKEIRLQLALEEDGTLSGQGRDELNTAEAARAREVLAGFTQAQRQQVMESGLAGAFPGARLESWSIQGLDEPDRPLVLEYRLRTTGLAEREAEQLVLRGGFYPYRLAAGLAAQARRFRPLLIEDETRLLTTVEIRLPPGATAEVPAELRLDGPLSDFSYRARLENDRLILEKRLRVRAGRVSPSEFQAFKEFCLRVDQKDVEPIRVFLPRSVRAGAR